MSPSVSQQPASRFIMERYRDRLPVTERTPMVTLGEGGTPLIRSRHIQDLLGLEALYFKLEYVNPTGSFKDRGMVVAVAKAAEEGARAVICASTGNTSAAAAAYATAHGLKSYVVVPSGKIAMGKLAQAIIHGAEIVQVDGSFDDALTIVRALATRHEVALVNSVNPHRLEGQKTASFEIVDDLGEAPDLLCIPVGNAGNITAYWRGFEEYFHAEKSQRRPRMWGFQAEGAAPLVLGRAVEHPETVATAIRVGNPASWDGAVHARDASEGAIAAVSDDEILEAYRLLASREGVFCEPASAASVAGLMKQHRDGADLRGKVAVCVLTGHGLKDPDTALHVEVVKHEAKAETDAVEQVLGWA
ncbi:MAG: threonine synthase [Dehalococcoidia bacterium]|nr:threonine synthase [Dehalococcoidia bacterium]